MKIQYWNMVDNLVKFGITEIDILPFNTDRTFQMTFLMY